LSKRQLSHCQPSKCQFPNWRHQNVNSRN
jgi:hypothetical protein